jgi:hypothetical protein
MTIADLLDLEAQLWRDREEDPAALAARDRALTGGERLDGRAPHVAVARWLASLRRSYPGVLHPGATVARALRALAVGLAVAGFVLGWGAVAAALRFEGPHPVNVWDYLLLFVGLQLALLALLLVAFAIPHASLGVPLLGTFRGLLGAIYPRLAARGLGGGERVEEWRNLLHVLRSRRSLYTGVEPWLLLSLTQAFGVAFNVGALLAMLRFVVFSDVAFSWSTTLLNLDADRLLAVVRGLSTPWAWFWPDAVPTRELVAATRYSRLEGAYLVSGPGRAADPTLVGAWWPFLVAAVATYGLLPRVVALAAARLRTARALSRLPLDDVQVRCLLDRLTGALVETASPEPDTSGPAEDPAGAARPAAPPQAPAGGRCALVPWRDAPLDAEVEAAVARQARCRIGPSQRAGGRAHEEGRVDWAGLAAGNDGVVVLAEAWEAPDVGVMRLLRALREALGPGRRLLVLLGGPATSGLEAPDDGDVAVWRDALLRLEDPWLAVEPLGRPA